MGTRSRRQSTSHACQELERHARHFEDKTNEDFPRRFVCPGCGERATAGGFNRFCSECKAFVHFDCLVKHMFTSHTCPICGSDLE